ncbi:MAG: hypothetical protein ACI9W4_000710 [Rhodothermales bacterium]
MLVTATTFRTRRSYLRPVTYRSSGLALSLCLTGRCTPAPRGLCFEKGQMPRMSEFYGIEIAMYYREHSPPHFHAAYSGSQAGILIGDGSILQGDLPRRAARMVRRWAEIHHAQTGPTGRILLRRRSGSCRIWPPPNRALSRPSPKDSGRSGPPSITSRAKDARRRSPSSGTLVSNRILAMRHGYHRDCSVDTRSTRAPIHSQSFVTRNPSNSFSSGI